jgi:head-tail adaptor
MAGGLLPHRIALERLTRAPDLLGGYTETWAPVEWEDAQAQTHTVTFAPASVQPLGATAVERLYGDTRVEAPVAHQVWLRWDPRFAPLVTDRVIFEDRILTVRGVEQVNEGRFWWRLFCVEEID